MKKYILIFLGFYFSILVFGQNLDNQFIHPRGLITVSEVTKIRERIKKETFLPDFIALQKITLHLENKMISDTQKKEIWKYSFVPLHQSYMYLLTNEKKWAYKAFHITSSILKDSIVVKNNYSFGLTRSAILQNLAITYDFCYSAWSDDQRKQISSQLLDLIISISSTMGFAANYSIESNWMAVRWGSVILASAVWDDFEVANGKYPSSRSLAYLWDARSRLQDQMNANLTSNGWNIESMGYHTYDWSFAGPALISLQHIYSKNPAFELENYCFKALNAIFPLTTSVVSINSKNGKGIKADLADDNCMLSNDIFAMAFRLYPQQQIPVIKWIYDYLDFSTDTNNFRSSHFYKICWYPDSIPSVNPEKMNWLNYADKEQGVVVFRNRFLDKNDIVATFTATAQRKNGHQGPDNLTFRIIGLGNLWAIGAGRTGIVDGQTNLFPDKDFSQITKRGAIGMLHTYFLDKNGSGFALASGSCMDVVDHSRYFEADYSKESGAQAVFIVADSSANGKIWRLNTPEFNTIKINTNGFTLTAPNGATLNATVLKVKNPLSIKTGKLRYGGKTIEHNTGICFEGECYENSNYIDIKCNGSIIVIITLQPKDSIHPTVSLKEGNVIVGSKNYYLKK